MDRDNLGMYSSHQKRLYIIVENKLHLRHMTRSKHEDDTDNSGTDTDEEPDPSELYSKAEVTDVLCKLHARLSLLEAQSGANVGPASRIR